MPKRPLNRRCWQSQACKARCSRSVTTAASLPQRPGFSLALHRGGQSFRVGCTIGTATRAKKSYRRCNRPALAPSAPTSTERHASVSTAPLFSPSHAAAAHQFHDCRLNSGHLFAKREDLRRGLFVRTLLAKNIGPLVIVHAKRITQRPVLALVNRVQVRALVHQSRKDALIL